MAMQAAEGIRALHQENVIHRDLACRNLLVDENFDIMVSDFGFARQKQDNTTKVGFRLLYHLVIFFRNSYRAKEIVNSTYVILVFLFM